MRPLALAGNINVDLILGPVTPWPAPGTEVMVAHDDLRVGGAAGNSALVWQAMGLPFQFAANLGDDHFGTWLGAAFPDHARGWPVSTRRTTLSVGLTHPDGERTFFTTDGHLGDMSAADVIRGLDGAALRGGLLLLCGTFVTEGLASGYGEIFDWADAHDIAVALDTGWPTEGWTKSTCTRTMEWLARAKIALFNEIEATGVTRTDSVKNAAHALREAMPEGSTVVIKRGAEGALALDGEGRFYRSPAANITVIDTIGAGDIFNAGFLVAFARGVGLGDCLRHGTATAALAISTLPRQFVPAEQEPTA